MIAIRKANPFLKHFAIFIHAKGRGWSGIIFACDAEMKLLIAMLQCMLPNEYISNSLKITKL